MADFTIQWDPNGFAGDWVISGGTIATGNDLETSVLIMLFTDRVLPPGTPSPDGTDDPRGWWGDTYEELPIGSLLWTLRRRSISNAGEVLKEAEDICASALQPLIDDGVAATVDVEARWGSSSMMFIAVTITEPDGTVQDFNFAWAWAPISGNGGLIAPVGAAPPLVFPGQLVLNQPGLSGFTMSMGF